MYYEAIADKKIWAKALIEPVVAPCSWVSYVVPLEWGLFAYYLCTWALSDLSSFLECNFAHKNDSIVKYRMENNKSFLRLQ